jgi:hypothetical protein
VELLKGPAMLYRLTLSILAAAIVAAAAPAATIAADGPVARVADRSPLCGRQDAAHLNIYLTCRQSYARKAVRDHAAILAGNPLYNCQKLKSPHTCLAGSQDWGPHSWRITYRFEYVKPVFPFRAYRCRGSAIQSAHTGKVVRWRSSCVRI